jgi:dephospho-CoA kinase
MIELAVEAGRKQFVGSVDRLDSCMLLMGITGGIASGKTEVAKVFRRRGAVVLSGDQIGRKVVESNKSVLRKLVTAFGEQIMREDGTLNRQRLGEIAFSSARGRDKLNKIVHPHLLKELRRRIRDFKRKGKRVVVVDAALICEWGLERELDLLVFVQSSRESKIRRLQRFKGYSRKEALDRIRSQLPDAVKKSRADFIIRNNGSLAELRKKALRTWEEIVSSPVN